MISDNVYTFFDNLIKNTKLKISFISSCFICLIAHAYAYFNASFMQDRTRYFSNIVFDSAIRAKWFAQFVDLLTSFNYLPWLSGVLEIFFISISVYAVITVIDIKHNLSIWLISGLFATNISFIASHFYWSYDIISALFFVSISLLIWNKIKIKILPRFLLESIFIALSLATYGSYASVGPTVIIVVSIIAIFNKDEIGSILKRGFEYVFAFMLGCIVYYAGLRIFIKFQNLSILNYMGEDKLGSFSFIFELFNYFKIAYQESFYQFIGNNITIPVWWSVIMIAINFVLFANLILKNCYIFSKPSYLVILLLLLAVYPFSSGLIYILSFGNVHSLMIFTYVILYVVFVKIAEVSFDNSIVENNLFNKLTRMLSSVVVVLTIVVIYKGVLVSNNAYSKMDNIYTKSLGIANRIVERIENCDGYNGSETIVFIGDISRNENFYNVNSKEFLEYILIDDKKISNSFTYEGTLQSFISNILGEEYKYKYYSEDEFSEDVRKIVDEMNLYPYDNSVVKVNDYILIKMENYE